MNKNYWHIQLHPDERSDIETIKSILTKKKVIGMAAIPDLKIRNKILSIKP